MNTFPVRFGRKGFTLIELLIVIVIIGILAGVVLVVLNPAKQQRKASESVLAASVNKLCLALNSCAATASAAASCGTNDIATTLPLIGAISPTAPLTAVYASTISSNLVTITGTLAGVGGSETPDLACTYSCAYDFGTGVPTPFAAVASAASNCY